MYGNYSQRALMIISCIPTEHVAPENQTLRKPGRGMKLFCRTPSCCGAMALTAKFSYGVLDLVFNKRI